LSEIIKIFNLNCKIMTAEEKQQSEIQMKLERLKVYLSLGEKSIWERYKILPTISTLAATLLVVATFNKELLPVTPFIKVILAILLLLIPVSLVAFLLALHEAETHSREKIAEITEEKNWKDNIKRGLQNFIPWIITAIFSIIIIIITFLILGGSFNIN